MSDDFDFSDEPRRPRRRPLKTGEGFRSCLYYALAPVAFIGVVVICGVVAHAAGGPVIGGLGLFVGFLIAVVLVASGRTKTCPQCASRVPYAARLCRYCRQKFLPTADTPTSAPFLLPGHGART